jgi:hypothetical protein
MIATFFSIAVKVPQTAGLFNRTAGREGLFKKPCEMVAGWWCTLGGSL